MPAGGWVARARRQPWLAAGLLALALLLVFRVAGNASVAGAEGYVEKSVVKARKAFATLSLLKAALAVVEGSELAVGVGVGANIEVGDSVQPVYDLVDMAWRVSMVAWATLEAEGILLAASAHSWPDYLAALGIALAALASWQAVPRGGLARRLGATMALVGLGVRFLLPVTLVGAQAISTRLIGSRLVDSQEALGELGAEMGELESILSSPGGALERMNAVRAWFNRHGYEYWSQFGSRASEHAVTLAAAFLLDVVLLPLVALALMWALLKRVGRGLLDTSVAGVLGAAKAEGA